MKGLFVAKPLLFNLEIPGDDFCQGDNLITTLTVTNSSAQALEPLPVTLDLCCADLKKLKARDAAALSVVQSSNGFKISALAAQSAEKFNFTFSLDRNCVVSDKADSLCFQYGSGALPNGLTQLPVTVKPHRHIQNIITVFESPLQFIPRSYRTKNGWVEYKLKPPSSRELAQLEELTIAFSFAADALKLRYDFKIKSFDTSTTKGSIKKTKSSFEQTISASEYLLTEHHLNISFLEGKISEALQSVASGI